MDYKKLKTNPSLWQNFRKRAEIVQKIREFFINRDFLEVQTPNLAPALIPESYLEVFETSLKDKVGHEQKAYLTTSPEMWHKKLLAAGSGNIFEITKSFRNTDIGGHFHNPEFTILEWYRVGSGIKETMVDCEQLLKFLYKSQNKKIKTPFERITVVQAFEKYAQVKEADFFSIKQLRIIAEDNGIRVNRNDSWETVYNLIFVKLVEPNLGIERPTFIYNYPACFAPLAKTDLTDSRFKQRFELYVEGVELADAYDELTDPDQQKKEFENEIEARKQSQKLNHEIDWEFIKALRSGLPSCSGVALGVDRLIMLLLGKKDIGEVILFSGEDLF